MGSGGGVWNMCTREKQPNASAELYSTRKIQVTRNGKLQSSPWNVYLTGWKGEKTAKNAQAIYRRPRHLKMHGYRRDWKTSRSKEDKDQRSS
mmetsp:Transcript_20404/g.68141  ORF Transcript_20404/g.68141 Transcript_20404/m.68141 type:complete len:92 (+) Transcript_20404:434-709(+)